MRHFLPGTLILSIIGTLAVIAGCGGDTESGDGESFSVVATIIPVAALAQEVAGDRAEVVSIIPAGTDPHDFEPTASDLRAINDADLILRHGAGLDDFLEDALGNSDAPVVVVTDGLALEPPALEHESHDGHDHDDDGLDPHAWHDPALAQAMVENIRDALIAADPDGAAVYEANAQAYNEILAETDAEIEELISNVPPENRKLVTNHDAFGYFARAYGLEIVGAVIPSASTGAEPSAADTAQLLEIIEREGVKAIFAESSVNPGLARQLANDAGVAIVDDLYGDTLGDEGSPEATVHGMLLYNAKLIADALR